MTGDAVPIGVFVGLATMDVVHRVDRLAGRNEKVTALRQDVAAGGPATGAALTYAALGGHSRLVTVLGASPVAGLVRNELEARGVEVVDVDPDTATEVPVSAVQVDARTGERSITSADAAGHAVQMDGPAREVLDRALEGAAVVLLDGHHPALAVAAARHVAVGRGSETGGATLLLDAGRWRPVMAELLGLVDIAICSADFRLPGDEAGPTPQHVRDAGPAVVVITHGAEPVLWAAPGGRGEVAVPTVAARDTSGAGDAFHGAYAWSVAHGGGTTDAIAVAVTVASHRVGSPGPRDWLRTLPRVATGPVAGDTVVGQA